MAGLEIKSEGRGDGVSRKSTWRIDGRRAEEEKIIE
jgi:hypothetical protein